METSEILMLLMLGGYDLKSGLHGKERKGPLQRQETEMKVAVYIRTVGSHHFNYCFEHKNGAGGDFENSKRSVVVRK